MREMFLQQIREMQKVASADDIIELVAFFKAKKWECNRALAVMGLTQLKIADFFETAKVTEAADESRPQ